MRLAILVTVFWIAGFAAFLIPWEGDVFHFLSASLGRAVLERFDLKKLTTQVGKTLLEIFERRFPCKNTIALKTS